MQKIYSRMAEHELKQVKKMRDNSNLYDDLS
jgi:hypothetical protein